MKDKRSKMQRSRCKNSLLDEHWKRKQRLKIRTKKLNECQSKTRTPKTPTRGKNLKEQKRTAEKTAMTSDILSAAAASTTTVSLSDLSIRRQPDSLLEQPSQLKQKNSARKFRQQPARGSSSLNVLTRLLCPSIQTYALITLILFTCCMRGSQIVGAGGNNGQTVHSAASHMQSQAPIDPRPTIYSGQVSFGLLLSAHSSLGAELSTSASHQRSALMALVPPPVNEEAQDESNSTFGAMTTVLPSPSTPGTMGASLADTTLAAIRTSEMLLNSSSNALALNEPLATGESGIHSLSANQSRSQGNAHQLKKRQIFNSRQKNTHRNQNVASASAASAQSGNSKLARKSQLFETSATCSQINANALYAGMGAIWASHQANLVGDSQLTIGTYVYDSCNDLDVGQRQSVRIVSNLNAFQQTTCEAPRGSPISLTIAHGDNQLKAIQLLTSFRVPVVTTKEPFELEDYNQLSRDQKRFLFSTAHSSRHLAIGALRFTKRIVSRSTSSPKLPNQYNKMSSKNGLIVISQNLPSKFINYLTEMIPNHVNYEMLQSYRPIDQIRSVEALEAILVKSSGTSPSSSESRIRKVIVKRQDGDSITSDSATSRFNDDSEGSGGESSSGQEEDQTKMLSPTILMFITPSEAIDLVTRLRNDLAEVSRYYSLIVTTREDISPALQTIFHRGGSRLCSGKAFYTISSKPDDIGEFSRYFRDTTQIEGENSDHPLICEYAKYKSMTKTSSDLDDIGTEPVIKAVWAAAAALKSVYKKECGGNNHASGSTTQSDSTSNPAATVASGRVMNSRQSTSKNSECMIKTNKNLSSLVQRALKRLDTTINSTGLQALDGFRLKFDDMNELMTNEFSIKYVNKECEITELGHYSGLGDSSLHLDEETLVKSLESILPDPWPVAPVASTPRAQSTTASGDSLQKLDASTSSELPSSTAKLYPTSIDTTSSPPDSDSPDTTGRNENGRRSKEGAGDDSVSTTTGVGAEDDEVSSTGPFERGGAGSESAFTETPVAPTTIMNPSKRQNKQTYDGNKRIARKKNSVTNSLHETSKKRQQPVTANGRGLSSISDSETSTQPTVTMRRRNQSNSPEESTTPKMLLAKPMRELKPFPAQTVGTTLKEWVPSNDSDTATTTTRQPMMSNSHLTPSGPMSTSRLTDGDDERVDPGHPTDLRQKGTTQAPVVYTTLPESDGNTDLDHPPTRTLSRRHPPTSRANLETSATTESSDYITSTASINLRTDGSTNSPTPLSRLGLLVNNPLTNQTYRAVSASGIDAVSDYNSSPSSRLPSKLSFLSADLNMSPLSVSTSSTTAKNRDSRFVDSLKSTEAALLDSDLSRGSRSKLRSHLNWIYSSWFGLTILAANICGALITLYILTFLLLKNCDGSLDRENQGLRSMHLLAVIVLFFGSTLFIVYPTPGLCLLRTSWQNFALVLLFGSLLLQAMQARSMRTLGLGGRPNRLNQFLTLVFMVGVQVSFELQRWKYESPNYLNFVYQHFGSGTTEINQKLSLLTNSITSHFNPLNSFSDQVTPISIQISEQYQSLLSDYCTQKSSDYLQSQIYLFIVVILLIIFSASTRRSSSLLSNKHQSARTLGSRRKLTSATLGIASGNLVASQHEANITPSHFQSPFTTSNPISGTSLESVNVFAVSMVCIPIYIVSVFLHVSGQSSINRDLIPSVTMVTIAFSALIGIFLPVLRQIHRFEDILDSSLPDESSAVRTLVEQQDGRRQTSANNSPPASAAFTMFPEFAPTGLRRPPSTSGESSSGAGSRRPFADTKESRRNMGTMLANLGPSVDSLRSMGFYDNRAGPEDHGGKIDPGLLNLKLNLGGNDNISALNELNALDQQAAKRPSKGEKRLIMLDVDPCCPRHGHVSAWPRGEASSSKGCRSRSSHNH